MHNIKTKRYVKIAMKLKHYFEKHPEISQKHLAEQLGVTPEFVSMLVTGKRTGSIEKCILIEELTNGEVTVEDLRPQNSWNKMRNNLLRRMINQ